MTARTPERTQFLADVLITAVEGGVNGWAAVRDYHHDAGEPLSSSRPHAEHVRCTLIETDEDGRRARHEVTVDTIARGIRLIDSEDFLIDDTIRYAVHEGSRWNDTRNIDAGAADAIVQAGLFGTLVYG